MIKAVVFDLGQVLSSPPNLFDETAARLGVAPADLEARYWTGRDAYDHGAPNAEYWGGLTTDLGLSLTPEQLDQLAVDDMALWTRLRPAAEAILEEVRAAVPITALLSNSPHALAAAAEQARWRPLLDHVFVSAPMGVMKPDPEIYRRVTEALGVDPDEIAFVDDKQANVDGALAAGWRAHLWRDDADTRAWLVGLGVLS